MAPMLITAFIGIILAYYIIQRLRFKLPPGPKAWPIIGNFYGLKPIQFRCFNEWAQTYGPIISIWFGSNLNIVVSNSELAKQVLKEHDQELANRFRIRSQAKFSQAGIDFTWADYGPHYVKMRKISTVELFSPKRIETLRPIRDDEVNAMVATLYRECTTSNEELLKGTMLRKYLGGVALNNITRLVLGKRFMNPKGEMDEQGKEFRGIVETGRMLLMKNLMAEHIPLLRWLKRGYDLPFQQYRLRTDRLTVQIMEEHTKARLASGNTKQHFVDAMLSLKDVYGLTDDNIIGVLWNMITAGMDTTAISVEWAMAELLRKPTCLQKAQEELDKVIGHDRAMTEDDITNLPYLQAIVKEALRLHPPTPLMLPHRANSHVKIGGYDIPKGTTVYVNVWAISRDPNIWADPIEFKPERFIGLDFDIMKGHDFKVLPFGAGRRVCPGAQLGLKLVTSMLGRLLHQFNWAPPAGVKPEEINVLESDSIFVTYMAIPLKAQSSPRLPGNLYQWIPLVM